MEILVEDWPPNTRLFAMNISRQLDEAGICFEPLNGEGWGARLYGGDHGFMVSDLVAPESTGPGTIAERIVSAVRSKAPGGKQHGVQVVATDDACCAALEAQGFKQMGATQALTDQVVRVMQYNWPTPISDEDVQAKHPNAGYTTKCLECGKAWCAPELQPPFKTCAECTEMGITAPLT